MCDVSPEWASCLRSAVWDLRVCCCSCHLRPATVLLLYGILGLCTLTAVGDMLRTGTLGISVAIE